MTRNLGVSLKQLLLSLTLLIVFGLYRLSGVEEKDSIEEIEVEEVVSALQSDETEDFEVEKELRTPDSASVDNEETKKEVEKEAQTPKKTQNPENNEKLWFDREISQVQRKFRDQFDQIWQRKIPVGELIYEKERPEGKKITSEETDRGEKVLKVFDSTGKLDLVEVKNARGEKWVKMFFDDGSPKAVLESDGRDVQTAVRFHQNGKISHAKFVASNGHFLLVKYAEDGSTQERWILYRNGQRVKVE